MARKGTTKKIVLVIVEGPSDDEALGLILSRLFDENVVHVVIRHGDITSDNSITANNIVAAIGNMVKEVAATTHYKASDFQQVIHLVDMDGAYIADEDIIQDDKHETPWYSITEIRVANPDNIISRNKRKRENIDRICTLGKVWNSIPYRAYYMSSSLDHVLYDKLNSTDEDKKRDAQVFARKYKDRLDNFLSFISDSDFAVGGVFHESWKYIKNEKHSLERHTNLGLCFTEIRQRMRMKEENQNVDAYMKEMRDGDRI